MGLHLRGNTEAFMRAATPHKKLRIHAGTHVHPFYTEEGRHDQLRFFDHWLKGIDNGVMDEPPVKLAIRKGRDEIEWRHEHEWPLARTQWTKYYFDLSPPAAGAAANTGGLVAANPAAAGSRTYPATSLGSMGSTSAASSQVMGGGIPPGMGVALETPPLAHDTEVTGPVAAVLWVSSSTEDMDLFLQRCATSTPTARKCWRPASRARPCRWRKAGCGCRIVSWTRSSRGRIARIIATSGGFT